MATADDYSATSMPKVFLVVTASLILLRIVTSLTAAMSAPTSTGSSVQWQAPTNYASLPPKQSKLVLYQFYAAWSDPCKRMDQTALSNSQVTQMIGDKFLPIRVVDVIRENGKNPNYITELEKRYRVFALPTLVVVDESGESVGSLIGDCSSLTTYRFLSRALHKQPPIKAISYAVPQHSFSKKHPPKDHPRPGEMTAHISAQVICTNFIDSMLDKHPVILAGAEGRNCFDPIAHNIQRHALPREYIFELCCDSVIVCD